MPHLVPALASVARSATRLDRAKIAPGVGAIATLGVAITLVVGRASGHTVAGVTAAIGALSGGFAAHQGTYRSRVAVVLVATAAMAAAAFVGATLGHDLGAFTVVTAAVSLLAGLIVCLGTPALVVGVQAVVGLVVFSQFSLPAAVAAEDAGLVLAGGTVAAALVAAPWPLRRFPAERRALARAYRTLADFCRRVAAEGSALLDPGALDQLSPLLGDPQPFGGSEAVASQALVGQADRLRLELAALGRAQERLPGPATAPTRAALRELLREAAEVLEEIASAVEKAEAPRGWDERRERFEAALERLRAEGLAARGEQDRWVAAAVVDAVERGEALAGQLRAAGRIAAVLAGEDPALLEALALGATVPPRPKAAPRLREDLATLRSNLSLSSQALRHALRLAVTMALAVLVSRAVPLGHHYWLPMTAMLVLRPDFTTTFSRGLSRIAGTLVGAGLVTLLLAAARPDADWLIAITVALTFASVTLVLANYAIFSVFIASLVVCLLAFVGEPGIATAGDRSAYTVLGAAIALAAYMAWPTWEARSLPETLAELAELEGLYAREVLAAWADPASADRAAIEQRRVAARLARTNAAAAVTRWQEEPAGQAPRAGMARRQVAAYMAEMARLVQGLLALHAELPEPASPGLPAARKLGEELEEALQAIAARLRGEASPGLPALRQEQLSLAASLGFGPPQARLPKEEKHTQGVLPGTLGGPAAVVLAGETDVIVNAVNTLAHLVGLDHDEPVSLEGGRPGT